MDDLNPRKDLRDLKVFYNIGKQLIPTFVKFAS